MSNGRREPGVANRATAGTEDAKEAVAGLASILNRSLPRTYGYFGSRGNMAPCLAFIHGA